MNFFRRKSFQNSSSSKDHYFLPDENQKDSSSQNRSDQEHQSSEPHERVIINNFSDNAKIKINIVYDDGIKVDRSQKILSKNIITETKVNQSSPNRKFAFQNGANQRMGVFDGDSAHPPTPIKTPKYNYRHAYDRVTDNIETPMHRFSNHQVNYLDTKQNHLSDDRKNQRYFNTQVLYPYSSAIHKTPQTAAQRQANSINFNKERTPFPEQSLENSKKDFLHQKRLEISQRIKNRALFLQPKQKSFYKVPQFNLNESINGFEQNKQNKAENDKPFEQIGESQVERQEVEKGQRRERISVERQFFVREQISDDFLQDRDEERKRGDFENCVKNSGYMESQIAEQVQHENSFFHQAQPKSEIEDVIMPKMKKPKDEKCEKAQNHVCFEQVLTKEEQQKGMHQQEQRQQRFIRENTSQMNQDNLFQLQANRLINRQEESCNYNESRGELNELNVLQVQKQRYLMNQSNEIEAKEFHQDMSYEGRLSLVSQQERIQFKNHNIIQPESNLYTYKSPQQHKEQQYYQGNSQETTFKELPLAITTKKWNQQRSPPQSLRSLSQSLNVRQYQTRPQTIEVVMIDNQQQNLSYQLDETPNKSILQCNDVQTLKEEQKCDINGIVPKIQRTLSDEIQKQEDSINELSEIQKNSPREQLDKSELNQNNQSHQEKPYKLYEPESHQKYTSTRELVMSTNKKSPLCLTYESVVSYSISPSPKNIKFSPKKHFNHSNQNQTHHQNTFKKKTLQVQQLSIMSSDKISLTSSIQHSHSRSKSKDSPKTYTQLQKYKRLFKKQTKTKNPENSLINQSLSHKSKDNSTVTYLDLHKPQKYSQRSSLLRNQQFIKVQHNNNEQYQVNDTPKSREKIKNYFAQQKSYLEKQDQKHVRFSYPRNQQLHNQQSESLLDTSQQIKEKVTKINLKDKKAQDLFTKHKDEFLNKLKRKEKHQQFTTHNRSSSKSSQKPIYTKLTYPATTQHSPNLPSYQSTRTRQLSPYMQNLTNRLSSPMPKQYICQHYKKHSRRELRTKFKQLLQKQESLMLRKYYFSQEEINQIFIEEILGREINEMYWAQVLRSYGDKKLERIRLRAKANFHPFEKSIVRQEQLLGDARRTYGFDWDQ